MPGRIPYVRILSISIAVIVLINVCALGACFMVQLGPVASQKAMPARPAVSFSEGMLADGNCGG
jgi:hypothetical protein